ncbi:carbohydrate ABC transporter permease [Psychromonas sp. KJ10-10]|uniref:carbohydrate ABC transporter permease n=1 Tax=Psychromonas sp. KJ10-10 TaxID=3391823 RepID=UPI0039B5E537
MPSLQSPLERAEARFGWKLVAPTIVILSLLILYPLIYNVYLSFFDVQLNGDKLFVGFDNYSKLLSNPDYYLAMWTTALYLIGTVVGTTVLGLAMALLLRDPFKGRGLVNACYYASLCGTGNFSCFWLAVFV